MPSTFSIRARDKYGNPRTTGGDAFALVLRGPCGLWELDARLQQPLPACSSAATTPLPARDVIDRGDGTYLAVYTLTRGGRYWINVQVRHRVKCNSFEN